MTLRTLINLSIITILGVGLQQDPNFADFLASLFILAMSNVAFKFFKKQLLEME